MELKIKVFKYKVKTEIDDDFPKVIAYFKKHGINLNLEISDTDVLKSDVVLKLMLPNDGKCDVVMYIYEKNLFSAPTFGLAFSVSPTLRGIYLATDQINDSVDYTWKSMCHEIMHTLFYKFDISSQDPMDGMVVNGVWKPYYKNEELDAPDGNFAEAFKRLNKYIMLKDWKYFKPNEVVGLKTHFVGMLDLARGYAGIPFPITSGFRTPEHNKKVGGSPTSSHLDGTGVDILSRNSLEVRKIVEGAMKAGITGITVYKASNHVHLDLKPLRLEVK